MSEIRDELDPPFEVHEPGSWRGPVLFNSPHRGSVDPRMFDGRLPSFANTRSMRVAGGLGTVARVVGDAQEIYDQRIPVDDALQRIESLYKPYHRALRRLVTRVHREFKVAVLVDCHSMPSASG